MQAGEGTHEAAIGGEFLFGRENKQKTTHDTTKKKPRKKGKARSRKIALVGFGMSIAEGNRVLAAMKGRNWTRHVGREQDSLFGLIHKRDIGAGRKTGTREKRKKKKNDWGYRSTYCQNGLPYKLGKCERGKPSGREFMQERQKRRLSPMVEESSGRNLQTKEDRGTFHGEGGGGTKNKEKRTW